MAESLRNRKHNGGLVSELSGNDAVLYFLQNFMGETLAFKKHFAHFCKSQTTFFRLTFSMIRPASSLVILLLVLSHPV